MMRYGQRIDLKDKLKGREEVHWELVDSIGLVPSSIDKLVHIYKLGLAFENWTPHLSVGAENYRQVLPLESWLSLLSAGAKKP